MAETEAEAEEEAEAGAEAEAEAERIIPERVERDGRQHVASELLARWGLAWVTDDRLIDDGWRETGWRMYADTLLAENVCVRNGQL